MVLSSFEKETDRQYFFARLKNPLWIQPLAERGCFENPPDISILPNGNIQCPFWPELEYLNNICKDAPSDIVDEIIQIVLELPPVKNPMVYEEIIDMALHLDGLRSTRLNPKILEYARLDRQFRVSVYPRLLEKWTTERHTKAALELANVLVKFDPDPKAEQKKKKYSEIGRNQSENDEDHLTLMMTTILEPVARFNSIYLEVLDEGVRALVEMEPYRAALMLIDATDTMISLGKHQDDLASGTSTDWSKIWCPRLTKTRRDFPEIPESLVHTLTHACECVWKRSRDRIGDLDATLRSQRWDVFKRIRQHLYGLNPSQHTRPFIREFILAHDDYSKMHYGYEFQQMVRLACEYFGAELLTIKERIRIFDAILGGPPKEIYREFMGEHFTDSEFGREKRTFHHMQLRPFARVLFGKYADYFEELQASKPASELTDESYSPVNKSVGGTVRSCSPKSHQELSNLTDQELLDYINRWDNEHQDKDDWLIAITIDDLAGAFQSVFKDYIIPSDVRVDFWIENRDNIHRPIYVRAMVDAMRGHVIARNFDGVEQWFTFCEWILTHSDPDSEEPAGIGRLGDGSRENPRWNTSRRAVCDFVEACIREGVDVPYWARLHLANLLESLCIQYDSGLDNHNAGLLNRHDQLTEATDTTRGRALESLIEFGFWIRRHDDNAEMVEMKAILDKRFGSESECPLKASEYAVLGRVYQSIFDLDSHWAAAIKSFVFPQHDFPVWLQAFARFLRYSRPEKRIFDRVRDEYQFALDNAARLELRDPLEEELKDILGQHLFKYYIWGVLPLEGAGGLLDGFYKATDDDRQHWANLFKHVGHSLRNTGKQIEKGLNDRIVAFFEWRSEAGEPLELREFSEWLEAECLEPEWRLNAFFKVLQVDDILNEAVTSVDDRGDSAANCLPLDATLALRAMLPDNTPRVVECLAKLTDLATLSNVIYIPTADARVILNVGFDHDDEIVRENARRARENLLRMGYFSVLD